MRARHPPAVAEREVRQGPLGGGGCSCGTPATETELRNEPRQGCSYTVKRDRGGGVASAPLIRRTQEGCGGLRGENPAAFPQARPFFQQPFSLPESAQTLAGIAFRAAGKSVRNFPAASKFARKLFQQGILDSHSLLSETPVCS